MDACTWENSLNESQSKWEADRGNFICMGMNDTFSAPNKGSWDMDAREKVLLRFGVASKPQILK
jgi:hypothetical protein